VQAALDAWRAEYNIDRPYQSLAMAFPAARFTPAAPGLALRVPARQSLLRPGQPGTTAASVPGPAAASTPGGGHHLPVALEVARVVPPSGNLWIGSQQVWLGPALAGRAITIWVDETSLHVLLDGTRPQTLPSRLGVTELARLAAGGARPAGPSPLPPAHGAAIEAERIVNAAGLISLAGAQLNVGFQLADQRVTLRMDGTQMAVISHDGTLQRTLPCPVPARDRHRLRGARRAATSPPPPPGPLIVQRRISQRGSLMVATQRIHIGLIHARKIATVTAGDATFKVDIDGETVAVVPRTTSREIHRYKAHATQTPTRA